PKLSKEFHRDQYSKVVVFSGVDQCVKLTEPASNLESKSSSATTTTTDVKNDVGAKMDKHFMDNIVTQSFA
ncbi:hypothetical protein BGZ65_006625, partial [Modicella reniformis]